MCRMRKKTALIPTPAATEKRLRRINTKLGRAVRRHRTTELAPESEESAADAGLTHSSDTTPGIRRKRSGKSFTYLDASGKHIRDASTLQRMHLLAIPPAWTDVWICPSPRGHVQATGRDARRRKQYRYHPLWREVRDMTKYHRMVPFAEMLPTIRERVAQDLQQRGLGRQKVLAVVIRLMEETLIRIGNAEYAKDNHSYGLTTMQDSHIRIAGADLRFRFMGKSGKTHDVAIHDGRLAAIVRECRDLPGADLFQYADEDGTVHDVYSEDVNAYLRDIAGAEFTAKDFRTWAGTVHAALTLDRFPPCTSATQAKRNVVRAIEQVASKLGNTPAICRKCYIHPFILDSYVDQSLDRRLQHHLRRARKHRQTGLTFGEAAVLGLLRECFGE